MADVPVDERSERISLHEAVTTLWSSAGSEVSGISKERANLCAGRIRSEIQRLREIEQAARVALDATEEPCTCYEEPYAPCSYCGPFMRLRTALDADRGGQGE